MVNVPKKVATRFTKEIGKFQRVLKRAKDRDVNESDTVTIITDLLGTVFGFDKYAEITSEQAIRGTYCDLAVKVDDTIKYLIEVKAIGLTLKENHLRQAVAYGANEGIQWIVLTNGIDWEIYRIKFERPVSYDQVCAFDLLSLNPRRADDQRKLFLLCKEGLDRAVIEKFHEHVRSVNRFVIAALVQSDPVITVLRRELRRISPAVKVDKEEIAEIVGSEVLKRDVVEGEAAEEALRRVKKAPRKKLRKRTKPTESQEPEPPTTD